jgi:gliding motility-associated-like protein
MLRKAFVLMILVLVGSTVTAQTYSPIAITGYNHDVIADGTGTSSLATTSKEMDAITPSNFVMCTKQFAASNAIPSAYGLPDNGTIISGTRTYQLAAYGSGTGIVNNSMYLLRNETGTLTLTTPSTFTSLSFLVVGTEGVATVNVTVLYTDGTNQTFSGLTFTDWVGGASPIIQGFGRVKRINGPFGAGTYEFAPTDPRMYAVDVAVSCLKVVSSVTFSNVTAGTNASSNRAFVFAMSGANAVLPAVPVVPPVSICSGGATALTVQSPVAGLTYTWYTASSGGTLLNTGTTFNTPTLTANAIYYVQSANAGGCISTRSAVTVSIVPPLTAPTAPAPQICSGTTATLSVDNPVAGLTYSWYTVAIGGTAIATGASYTTAALTTNAIYYLQSSNTGGCLSARTQINVTILPPLSTPTIPAVQVCNGATATLAVDNPATGITYSWYTIATGGSPITTGATYTSPALTATTIYYAQASNAGGCISSRASVTVTVPAVVNAPTIAAAQVCSGATATLNVTSPVTGITYSWFTVATGGTAVATGTSYTSSSLTATTTYYVQAANSSACTSGRTAVTVTILAPLAIPAATPAEICGGSTAILSVISPVAGLTYNWFAATTGGTSISTGTTFTTPALTTPTTYYLECQNAGGCISASRFAVNVTFAAAVATPVVTASNITTSSVTFSWNAVTGATGYSVSVNGGSFGNPSSGATGTTHVITGLPPGQQVTIAVRALGVLPCQNSANGTATATTLTNQIFVPNVFSPNADGKNDLLLVYGNDLAAIAMKIFNQWGELIYETRDQSKGWDGTYKGKQQPIGVYVYVVNVTLKDGSTVVKKGSLSLVR